VGDLAVGASATVTIIVRVDELPAGGTLVNVANAAASDNESDPDFNNKAISITGIEPVKNSRKPLSRTDEHIGECLFFQPKVFNYHRGVAGMPDDIPQPPGAVTPESFDHDAGKSFHFGSKESPQMIKSWYKQQLPKLGWSILKDDAIETGLGTFERLFIKNKAACVSISIAKQPAPPRNSLVAIYTYPGPGRMLGARDVKLKAGYAKDEPGLSDAAPSRKAGSLSAGEGERIPWANDITNPIIRDMPLSESRGRKAASAAGDLATGMLGIGGGGMFGGGRGRDAGPQMVARPKGSWTTFTADNTSVEWNGWLYQPRSKKKQPEIRIAQLVSDSPDKGAPHMMVLQNRDGRILRPTGYMIFKLWVNWKLTVTITRETYVDGQLVDRNVTSESTRWRELLESYRQLMEAPGIWERLGLSPFGKLRGIIAQYPLPADFDPSEWSLISHVTSKSMLFGRDVIRTVPFVASMGQGKRNDLSFSAQDDGMSRYQQAHHYVSPKRAMSNLMNRLEYDLKHGTDTMGEAIRGVQAPVDTKLQSDSKAIDAVAPAKLSKAAAKKTELDASKWGRILIMAPDPQHQQLLKQLNVLSRQSQQVFAFQVSMLLFNQITGYGISTEIAASWNHQITNLAIRSARRWQAGISEKQKTELANAFSRLSPPLQRLFYREFMLTLSMNLFLDLRRPQPPMADENDIPKDATPASVL